MLYAGFVALIITLVVGSTMRKSDLVTADYYQQELQFQKRLDASRNMTALKEPIVLFQQDTRLVFRFPKRFAGAMKEVQIACYAPSDARKDYHTTVRTTENEVSIDRSALAIVPYQMQVTWTAAGREYYQELRHQASER